MKIAVCVKEVPDAAAPRRIDPATLRLDRSGEGALNPWDLSAVEEALRLVEAEGGEVVCVSMGPARAAGSLRKALAMGADRAVLVSDEALAGTDLIGDEPRAGRGARAGERRSRPLWPARGRFGRCRALGRRRRPAAAAARFPGGQPRGGRWACQGQAPDRVRLRRHRSAYAVRRRGLGCNQRTSLSVAQGDHGCQEKAPGRVRSRRPRPRPGSGGRGRRGHRRLRARAAATARGVLADRGRRLRRPEDRRLPGREQAL